MRHGKPQSKLSQNEKCSFPLLCGLTGRLPPFVFCGFIICYHLSSTLKGRNGLIQQEGSATVQLWLNPSPCASTGDPGPRQVPG